MKPRRRKSLLAIVALLLLVIAWPGRTQSTHSITLSWTAPTSGGAVATYTVKRSTSTGTEVSLQAGVPVTTFVDTTGVAGVKYFYVISAVNQFGESANSPEVSALFLGDPPQPPMGLGAVAK
jgi:fibronectin type 3 domain-containing protein